MNQELTRNQIEALLFELADDLAKQGLDITVRIVGGAALILQDVIDRTTIDVDASYKHQQQVADAVQRIATRHNLKQDWLNDRSTAFLPDEQQWVPFLRVGGVSIELAATKMLLAMKIASARHKDWRDLWALSDRLGIDDAEQAARIAYDMYGENSVVLPEPWPDRVLMMREVLAAKPASPGPERGGEGRGSLG